MSKYVSFCLLIVYSHALYRVQLSSILIICSGCLFSYRCKPLPNLSTKLRYLFRTCKLFNIYFSIFLKV